MSNTTEPVVLILEDEPIARLHLQSEFQRRTDYHVEMASGGDAAVSLAEKMRIDVLVADILMPGTDGVTAASRIVARQDTAVVFVTASSDGGTLERARALNPYALRTKPADMDDLVALVTEAVEARRNPAEEDLQPDFLLDTLYDTAAIGMCVTDENRRFVKVNRSYCDTYGYSKEELLGEEFTKVLPEEDRDVAAKAHDDFIAGRMAELPADWRVQTSTGDIRNIYVTAGRMFGTDGHAYKVTTVTDVTAWKQRDADLAAALAEKEVLLREVHHRVKNNLNTLSSLLNLQLEHYRDDGRIAEILTVSINRIKTMSAIYERLHQAHTPTEVDLAEYLEALARDLLRTSWNGADLSLDADIQRAEVEIDTGISLGLIVNELVTNSIKHAFAGAESGTVSLRGTLEDSVYTVEIWDSGQGVRKDFEMQDSSTLGLQLIQAVTGQRGGSVELVDASSAHFRATLPIE